MTDGKAVANDRKPRVYVVAYRADLNPDDAVWTLSDDPSRPGWETDSGWPGYGLTKAVAEAYAAAINAAAEGDRECWTGSSTS